MKNASIFKLSSAVGVQRKMTFLLLRGTEDTKKGFSSTLKFKFPKSQQWYEYKNETKTKCNKVNEKKQQGRSFEGWILIVIDWLFWL